MDASSHLNHIAASPLSYVNSLRVVCTVFQPRLKRASDEKHVAVHVLDQIFANISQIYDVHRRFLQQIQQRVDRW